MKFTLFTTALVAMTVPTQLGEAVPLDRTRPDIDLHYWDQAPAYGALLRLKHSDKEICDAWLAQAVAYAKGATDQLKYVLEHEKGPLDDVPESSEEYFFRMLGLETSGRHDLGDYAWHPEIALNLFGQAYLLREQAKCLTEYGGKNMPLATPSQCGIAHDRIQRKARSIYHHYGWRTGKPAEKVTGS